MSSAYDELLDATIQHLEALKSRGVRHVAVAPETLRALALPAKPQAAPAVAPAPSFPRWAAQPPVSLRLPPAAPAPAPIVEAPASKVGQTATAGVAPVLRGRPLRSPSRR